MHATLELAASRVVRPTVPEDAPRLVAMFERCSPEARYQRFLAPVQHFPPAHLVDVVRGSPVRSSWVVDAGDGRVVALGSWFRTSRRRAELGLLVEDAEQHRGLGSALLDTIRANACAEGIRTLYATTLTESHHVSRMLRRLGPVCEESGGPTHLLELTLGCCRS
jgi:GNAT superfamily N-acetyltransferase